MPAFDNTVELQGGNIIVSHKAKQKPSVFRLKVRGLDIPSPSKNKGQALKLLSRFEIFKVKKIFLFGLFLILAIIGNVYAVEDVSIENTPMNNKEVENCFQKDGIIIDVIKLNYVNAEDVAHVLAPLFSEKTKIIPFKPANSLIIKNRLKPPEELAD